MRRVFDAVARGDGPAVLALYDPEVEVDASNASGVLLGAEFFHGHEGLREWDRAWREAFEEVHTDLEELTECGDRVLSVSRYRVRGRASGIPVTGRPRAGLWSVRDGKVTRVVWFDSREDALEAAGRPD